MSEVNSSKVIRLATTTPFRSEQDPLITNIDGTVMSVHNAPVIRAISQAFGMPFKIVLPEDDEFGRKKADGTWTGVVGLLKRGEADMSHPGLFYDKVKEEVVNFTFPLYISDNTFISNKPEPYPKYFAIFEIFSLEVWLSIVISVISIALFLYFLLKKKHSLSAVLVGTVGNLLEKSFPFEERRGKIALILMFWFLGVTILTNSYKALILSVITFPKLVGIRSISDLAKAADERTVSCVSYRDMMPGVPWYESNDKRLISIAECMKRSVMEGLHGQEPFRDYPKKKAFIADRLDVITFAREYYVSDESFSLTHLGIGYSRSFCCPRKLESIVHRIVAADLYAKTLRDREFMAQVRMKIKEPPGYDRTRILPLTVKDFTGAFLVLFIGHLISFIVFLVEISRKHN